MARQPDRFRRSSSRTANAIEKAVAVKELRRRAANVSDTPGRNQNFHALRGNAHRLLDGVRSSVQYPSDAVSVVDRAVAVGAKSFWSAIRGSWASPHVVDFQQQLSASTTFSVPSTPILPGVEAVERARSVRGGDTCPGSAST